MRNFLKHAGFHLFYPLQSFWAKKFFCYRELLVSEKFLNNAGFPLWFYSLRRVSGLFWAKSIIHHNDSLWHPLHTKGGDEISMFWGPCLQSSISRLSFSFLALFFCYAVSSCVYDHNHPYLVFERLFLAENEAFPYLRRALAHPRRALAIL